MTILIFPLINLLNYLIRNVLSLQVLVPASSTAVSYVHFVKVRLYLKI